jgi:hypothetical protein
MPALEETEKMKAGRTRGWAKLRDQIKRLEENLSRF